MIISHIKPIWNIQNVKYKTEVSRDKIQYETQLAFINTNIFRINKKDHLSLILSHHVLFSNFMPGKRKKCLCKVRIAISQDQVLNLGLYFITFFLIDTATYKKGNAVKRVKARTLWISRPAEIYCYWISLDKSIKIFK